jgi:dUTP pyrophosphatase
LPQPREILVGKIVSYHVQRGDKIAQLVIARYEQVEREEGNLNSTERGAGGFGSSGG